MCSHLRFVPGMPATGEEGVDGRGDEGARAIPSQNHPRRRGEMPFYGKFVLLNMRFPSNSFSFFSIQFSLDYWIIYSSSKVELHMIYIKRLLKIQWFIKVQ